MNETIKSKMKAKHILYKKYIQNEKSENHFLYLKNLITELNELIFSTKASYDKSIGKNYLTHYCKQKHIDQY